MVDLFPQKYIDLYYQKMLYTDFLPIAHQLVIYQHDKKNLSHEYINNIDVSSFPSKVFLQEVWPVPGISFSKSYNYQLKKKLKTSIKSLKENIFTSLNLNYSNRNTEKKGHREILL